MHRTALIVGFVLIAAVPAAAACPSFPDNAASNYVENSTGLALCQQRELGMTIDRAASDAAIQAQRGNVQIELERQQALILQQQMLAATLPRLQI